MRSRLHLLILCTCLLSGLLPGTLRPGLAQQQPTGGAVPAVEASTSTEDPTRKPDGRRRRREGARRRPNADGNDPGSPGTPDAARRKSEASHSNARPSPVVLEKAAAPSGTTGSVAGPVRTPLVPQSGTTGAGSAGAGVVGNDTDATPTDTPSTEPQGEGRGSAPGPAEPLPPGTVEAPPVSEETTAPAAQPAVEASPPLPGNGPGGARPDAGAEPGSAAEGSEPGGATSPVRTGTAAPAAGDAAANPSSAGRTGTAGRSPFAVRDRPGDQPNSRGAVKKPDPAPITARAVLASWQHLFERSSLGFDQSTPGQAYQDFAHQLRQSSRNPRAVLDGVTTSGWGLWLGGLALVLLLVGGAVVERTQPKRWRFFWERVENRSERLPMGPWLVRLGRHAAVPVLTLVIWSVGGLFAGTTSPGFTLIQGLLAIWIVFRLLDRLLPAHLELKAVAVGPEQGNEAEGPETNATGLSAAEHEEAPPVDAEVAAENAERLRSPFHRMLLFTAFWAAGWITMDFLAYRPDVVALWVAGGHLVLVLMAASILVRKRLVLSLLPAYESPAYQRFLRVVSALYTPLIYFSILIALLWVVGYRNLAGVFLARSWALVAIWLTGFGLFHSLYRLADRSIAPDPERAVQREQLLSSLHRLAAFVVLVFVYAFSLKVLALWEPWLHLRGQTWIEAGSIRVTGNGIWLSLLLGIFLLLVSRWLQSTLSFHVYPRMGIGGGEAYALNRLLHYAIVAGIVLLVLNNLGLSPTSLALVAGGLSVGLGFGLQNIANNLASGLILLTSRQVRQGDLITVGDQTGVVREVNLRATTVTTGDNLDLLIPNSKLLEDTLVNWTHGTSVVRSKVPFGVAYSADPAAVEAAVLSVAHEHPDVLSDPAPEVWFKNMGDNALEFELLVWTDLRTSIRPRVTSQLLHQLFRAFSERGIEIPYPQRDLHLRSGIPWDRLIQAIGANGNNGHAREAPVAFAASGGQETPGGNGLPHASCIPSQEEKSDRTSSAENG